MQLPLWVTPDILPLVCAQIHSVQDLAALSQVNKLINTYLFSVTGGKHWVHAGKLVCGEGYWPQSPDEEKHHPRYTTMIYMCPWVSEPQKVVFANKERLKKKRHPFTDEERANLVRLRGWAPETMPHYSETRRAIKVHNGVLMVVQNGSSIDDEGIEGHIYFVASKDLRLLRDMFYFSHETITARWIVTPGRILCGSAYRAHGWQFGLRDDREISLLSRDESAKTVLAFWAAFKGDMRTALRELEGMRLKDLSIHCMDLCHHTIESGSIDALRMLLDAEPDAGNHYNFVHALEIGRKDMAQLMLSKSAQASSGSIVEKYQCIGWHRISGWLEYGSHAMPKDLKRLMVLYRDAGQGITIDGGKTIPDIIDELMQDARHKMCRTMRVLRQKGI